LLDVGEIVGFMWVIGLLQKLLVFKAIRLVNYEFLGQKTAMKHFPKNLRSPLAPKLLVQLKKNQGDAKMVRISSVFMQFGGDPPLRHRSVCEHAFSAKKDKILITNL